MTVRPKINWDQQALSALLSGLIVSAVLWVAVASSGPVQWGDNGMLVQEAATGKLFPVDLGPLSHPLYHSVSVVIYRVFGATALAYFNALLLLPVAVLVARIAGSLGFSGLSARIAALAALLAHCVFWTSTKVEVYDWHLLLVLAALWMALDDRVHVKPAFRLFAVGLFTGLAAATHQLTFVVLLPVYVLLVFRHRLLIAVTIPGFLVGLFSCYPGFVGEMARGAAPFDVVRHYLTGAQSAALSGWEGSFLRFDKLAADKRSVSLLFLSLVGVQLTGLVPPLKSRVEAWTLYACALLNFLFAVSYSVNDRYTFFLPGAVILCILGIGHIERLAGQWAWRSTALVVALTLSVPLLLAMAGGLASAGRLAVSLAPSGLPYRNDFAYFAAPYWRDRSAERFVSEYAAIVPEGSIVAADWTPQGALLAAQVDERFPDRTVVPCRWLDVKFPDRSAKDVYLVRREHCEEIDPARLSPEPIGFRVSG